MLKLIAQDFIRLDAIDSVMPLYRELVLLTRQEPLNISYDLFIDREDPGHFIFIEEWPDRAAVDVHCATEHFKRIVPQIDVFQRAQDTYIQMRPAFTEY
ncbi:putative quinol monooxygenase [Leucobacter sp. UT-8R-CII-1-4]|uniref:putative quinol monooxygenase n=1 Tax=Leucobacter sp. UT-8R-CII-1-4 TaxID=3040075 RepID=UPI0024A98886|nr:putative quinol monooxygenase [Leucobacter sp. UT-8R-CII-1-4]MDI6024507.1 putative quinol monooxygenase [Leucobacter sp. UT-8R-CII-1-4]